MNSRKGFTLIEIITVIAIMGFLSSIVLVGLSGFRMKGRDAKRIAEIREVQNALELYFSATGHYPTQTSWADLSSELISANIGVTRVPKDPVATQSYLYAPSTTPAGAPTRYILGAVLEDAANAQLESGLQDAEIIGTFNKNFQCGKASKTYCVEF